MGPTIALATLGIVVAAHVIALAAHSMPWHCLGSPWHALAWLLQPIPLPWGIPMYIMEPTFTTNDYN